ncbi:hypothetical protein [Neptunomonas sp.]|uniref:DUF7873 family protein n=1 Tax=Neptunomonas sp. TaxID=1971898 RepID=UPI0035655961
MTKLNQWLAIERGVKTQTEKATTKIHHEMQKSPSAERSPLRGILQTYRPIDEDGERFPSKSQNVQIRVTDSIDEFRELFTKLIDLTATKDWANTQARGNVVVDGETLLANVPATHLLWLEKQLVEVRTFVAKLPTLPEDHEWEYDEDKGVHATQPIETHKTKKVPKSFVAYEATEQHPAQVQVFQEDVLVGYWTTIHYSGAIPGRVKSEMLRKIEKVLRGVQMAREAANQLEAEKVQVGDKVLDYIFG